MTVDADAVPRNSPVLGFESTVPRRYVHRQSVSEVFLTDCTSVGVAHRFLLGAQWPRLHGFYRTETGRYDAMLIAETLRQTAIYLGHTQYRVPLGHPFVMQTLRVDAAVDALAIGAGAAEVVLDASLDDPVYRGGLLSQFDLTVVFAIDGQRVGTGEGVANVLTPDAYQRLRWNGAGPRRIGDPVCPPPISPVVVGQSRPVDVVLGPQYAENRWRLRVDDRHPVLFDHPSDHVPGMLLLEAFRQSARAACGCPDADIALIEATYHRFVELDEPANVVARIDAHDPWIVRTTVEQWGEVLASGVVRLAPDRSRC
ncbi:A-factor biosynthesis protein [Rhodococcus ruber Chol-4]|uniref:Putative A-factor biosynthesis protein n=1 Tax=Rhodococcus ruber TaxID=1830 RepID=A0A098BU77_9NOCA|nr:MULTISPECIES: ScbA/BarX family gamma-butyrolactone biosynthesis protein [Rhodococcus]RIK08749.1 MAG: A-factor biosynthesis protein [Acidobacteriota bacterium]ATQ29394.1 A-factor biosynthesis protein [Rhodococcus ruber]AUM18409.1 A-factor biosynthesis protein [Rhodococcus ruber]AXY54064.1 A-factor biosynthesis protein [Rhodococcus ruber]KXF85930.1 A-factor biosynthesis protein [Rhodococcus ruber Chol-4]